MKNNHISSFPSELIVAELILDIFSDALNEGIEEITTREIISLLGVKSLDNYENKLYDLRGLTRKDIALYTDKLLEQFKPDTPTINTNKGCMPY